MSYNFRLNPATRVLFWLLSRLVHVSRFVSPLQEKTMWWDVRGKLDGKVVRYRVEAINQSVAETLAQWKGIEILAISPEPVDAGSLRHGPLLDAFGPFVGDVPPTLAE